MKRLWSSGRWRRPPALIYRHENELLLEFVHGRRFDPASPDDRGALGDFLGRLYSIQPQPAASDALAHRLAIDLRFLRDAGLIDAELAAALARVAERRRPASIVTGLDYVDPVVKNFVMTGTGRLCAIDLQSLRSGQPLGIGIVKAGVHWLDAEARPALVRSVERAAGISLSKQLPYLELCFRVGWTKRKLLQGKRRAIRIDLLRQLVEGAPVHD